MWKKRREQKHELIVYYPLLPQTTHIANIFCCPESTRMRKPKQVPQTRLRSHANYSVLFCFASNLFSALSLLRRVFVGLNSFNVSRAILSVFFLIRLLSPRRIMYTYFTMDHTSFLTLITFFYTFCRSISKHAMTWSFSLSLSLSSTLSTQCRAIERKKNLCQQ